MILLQLNPVFEGLNHSFPDKGLFPNNRLPSDGKTEFRIELECPSNASNNTLKELRTRIKPDDIRLIIYGTGDSFEIIYGYRKEIPNGGLVNVGIFDRCVIKGEDQGKIFFLRDGVVTSTENDQIFDFIESAGLIIGKKPLIQKAEVSITDHSSKKSYYYFPQASPIPQPRPKAMKPMVMALES